jgi:NADH dehydrogenase
MNTVTGAFGYIGRAIASRLLEAGESVRTVTTHPDKPNPFGDRVASHYYDFERPERLASHLRGSRTLFNTYWIRFPHGGLTYEDALENTRVLFSAAQRAGVERIVHISVTNAALESDLPYYAGKAIQERLLRQAGISFAILRPSLVFGPGDILVNNMAWLLRRFPLFPVFGSGEYPVQPIFLRDLADRAVEAAGMRENVKWDIVGPETFTFQALVKILADRISPSTMIVPTSATIGLALGWFVGRIVGDVILTRDEVRGLMAGLLISDEPPLGKTRFSEWVAAEAASLGISYHSELARHFFWTPSA